MPRGAARTGGHDGDRAAAGLHDGVARTGDGPAAADAGRRRLRRPAARAAPARGGDDAAGPDRPRRSTRRRGRARRIRRAGRRGRHVAERQTRAAGAARTARRPSRLRGARTARRGRRGGPGRLRPAAHGPGGTALEYGRRADEVAYLALPEHARAPRDAAGSYDYRFDTAAPVEVSADGVWHTIPVCEIEVGLDPEFVCVPALDDAVFGTVVLANASPHALLAGPADVSVAGEFLMTVPLPTLAPGARERVGVGVVESVQVSRNAHMRESTAGLRGGTAVLDHRIEIEAVNHLARPIRLDILERVPVTDDKDVRIEEHAGTPRWVEDTELRDGRHVPGARVWRVELAPGERKNLTGGYEIRIPAAKAVVGGNRRV
ncbi:DUF4139 domain-containing protein [Embleya sp. NBC_00896]|nr:DUF4139 domain-containing protein [Embleya sp. NBC_00896]